MSTANPVPETWNLTGDDARDTLARTGRWRLIRDGFQRLRSADGFSHARSIAYAAALIAIQGIIALVGLASILGPNGLSTTIVDTLKTLAPGPAGAVLTDAVEHAHKAGSADHSVALFLGLLGALITGTILMGQIERALNRLYGVERDRPTSQKYGRALVLTLSAGVLSVAAFVALALGRGIGSSFSSSTASVWEVVRWPMAFLLLVGTTALTFRRSPYRHQPSWSWLAFGAGFSVILVFVVTVGLDLLFRVSATFGETYGSLAGIVALLLWALLASIAFLFGAAVAVQLEAVRAGHAGPRTAERVSTPPIVIEDGVQPLPTR